jgi:hypothetical protein
VASLDRAVETAAHASPVWPGIEALMALRGISMLAAVTVVAELGTLQYGPVFGITDHYHPVVRVQVYSAELHVGLRQVKGSASPWAFPRASRRGVRDRYMIINAFRLADLAASSCKNIPVNVLALCAARKDPTDGARGERETSAEDTKADGPR